MVGKFGTVGLERTSKIMQEEKNYTVGNWDGRNGLNKRVSYFPDRIETTSIWVYRHLIWHYISPKSQTFDGGQFNKAVFPVHHHRKPVDDIIKQLKNVRARQDLLKYWKEKREEFDKRIIEVTDAEIGESY